MRTPFWTIAAVLLLCSAMASAEAFRAGAAKRVVTPDPLLPVSGGIGEPNPVDETRGDLFARAMVLEKGDTRVAFVGLDFLGWPSVLCERIRDGVKGIPRENILVSSTHTHSAPDPYGFPDPQGNHAADIEYLHWVCAQAADAVNEAVANLEDAHLKVRVDDAEGKIAYNYYAPQLYDPRCGVLQCVKAKGPGAGQPIVTMVNYASHPEVLGTRAGFLSPDFCGPLYDRIEEKTGGMALFLNGALGGMVTADNRMPGGQDGRTWEECLRIGHLLADEALRIIEDAKPQEDPGLYCAAKVVDFPVDSKLMQKLLSTSPLLDKPREDATVMPTQLNLVNVGSAQMLSIPGEALPNIGYYLKRNMKTGKPFLLGLTNEAFGYILTKVDFRSFKRYDYISFTSLGEQTGEVLIEALLDMVEENPAPDGQ